MEAQEQEDIEALVEKRLSDFFSSLSLLDIFRLNVALSHSKAANLARLLSNEHFELMLLLSSSRSLAFARMLSTMLSEADCSSFDDLMARFRTQLSAKSNQNTDEKRRLLLDLSSPESNSALWR